MAGFRAVELLARARSEPTFAHGVVTSVGLWLDKEGNDLGMRRAHFSLKSDHLILDLRCPQIVRELEAPRGCGRLRGADQQVPYEGSVDDRGGRCSL